MRPQRRPAAAAQDLLFPGLHNRSLNSKQLLLELRRWALDLKANSLHLFGDVLDRARGSVGVRDGWAHGRRQRVEARGHRLELVQLKAALGLPVLTLVEVGHHAAYISCRKAVLVIGRAKNVTVDRVGPLAGRVGRDELGLGVVGIGRGRHVLRCREVLLLDHLVDGLAGVVLKNLIAVNVGGGDSGFVRRRPALAGVVFSQLIPIDLAVKHRGDVVGVLLQLLHLDVHGLGLAHIAACAVQLDAQLGAIERVGVVVHDHEACQEGALGRVCLDVPVVLGVHVAVVGVKNVRAQVIAGKKQVVQRRVRSADAGLEALVLGVLVDALQVVVKRVDGLFGHPRDRGGTRAGLCGRLAVCVQFVVLAKHAVHALEDVAGGGRAQQALEVGVGVELLVPGGRAGLLVELHVDGLDRGLDGVQLLVHLVELVHHVVDGVHLSLLGQKVRDKYAEKTNDGEARRGVVKEALAQHGHKIDCVIDAKARRDGAA